MTSTVAPQLRRDCGLSCLDHRYFLKIVSVRFAYRLNEEQEKKRKANDDSKSFVLSNQKCGDVIN